MAADLRSGEATFLFADIAGFTALTEAHGDEHAADLVMRFATDVADRLRPIGGEHVKTIGDALMLRVPHADDAVILGLEIVDDVMRAHACPAVRVGMHHGPAVVRDGDWFGATVNVAARVAAAASAGEVLLTDATRRAAGAVAGVALRRHKRLELRNVRQPVLVHAALRAGLRATSGLVVDPVCRMAVDPDRAAGMLVHDGAAFHFCSLRCAAAFAQAPECFR